MNSQMNGVRYFLDFRLMPELFYTEPKQFLNALEIGKEEFFANVFNDFYQSANETFFAEDPKMFLPSQFKVEKYAITPSKFLYCVELPDEHEGSHVYCNAYFFVYDVGFLHPARVQFMTLETSAFGTHAIGGMSEDMDRHFNYGMPEATLEDTINKVLELSFKK